MNRRNLLLGLTASFIAAPAIVRVASIMPVKPPLTTEEALRVLLEAKMRAFEAAVQADLENYLWGEPHTSEMAAMAREYQWTPLVARAC